MTCDKDLERHPDISAQNKADFCNHHLLRPACVTHQLMGIRILQRRKCGDPATLANSVSILQKKITSQLFYDPRVVDVYLQRVLMLIESGARDKVKPVWLRRVLLAQSKAGGWGAFEPLIALPGGQDFGFSRHGISMKKPYDSFHATIQGVMIMSLLQE